jgi:hypothetical protein
VAAETTAGTIPAAPQALADSTTLRRVLFIRETMDQKIDV